MGYRFLKIVDVVTKKFWCLKKLTNIAKTCFCKVFRNNYNKNVYNLEYSTSLRISSLKLMKNNN